MKKFLLKSTILGVAVGVSGLGAWRAYNAYEMTDNTLLVENIEALSEASEPGASPFDMYDVKGEKNGKCIKFTSTHAPCPQRGSNPPNHGEKCDIITFSKVEGGYTYQKKQVGALVVVFYEKWKDAYGRCPSTFTKYDIHTPVPIPNQEHTYAD